ncbi:MAG TPA: branched-chain amino acid aminotransferase [Ferruginibacter sp.]|jgi:branched-chain amino acid aminotransferase|nr:branched-chain amino acid aminotransferase [Ferruginibacter sp.]
MIAAADFKITKVKQSKLKDLSIENLPFGKYFTDHMLEVDYINGEWQTGEIKPYQPLSLDPSLSVLHYGQSIFEGIKAYNDVDGKHINIFRPYENFKRFNISAERMMMPQVPEEIFIGGMRELIDIDRNWIPKKADHSLYIRPFMFNADQLIGVKPGEHFKFLILLSPTGPYYAHPMRIAVEEKYVRAAKGGLGFAKTAANYAASLYAASEAQKIGYDQVLWTDEVEHKYVQECGTMNVFFIIGNTAITPGLEDGTILNGVTRNSLLVLLKEMGFKVEERPLNIDEIMEAHKAGQLRETFGAGTAATISLIKELKYKDYAMKFDIASWKTAPELKRRLEAIHIGAEPDTHGWLNQI